MPDKFPTSLITPQHPDFPILFFIKQKIEAAAGGGDILQNRLPEILNDAVDFVLDPVRTARTHIDELDKVEKTFIGLKVEHFLRDMLGLPKGIKRDIGLEDLDVDIKNTIGTTWMIPPETYETSEPCLLIATAKFEGRCSLGIMLGREVYLGQPNRDRKKSVTTEGKRHILWLVEDEPYPASRWEKIDMARFRELRKMKGGNKRAAQFFRENLAIVVHRSVVEALLFDQDDFMRRLRKDGGRGTKEILENEGIVLACGAWEDTFLDAGRHGFPNLSQDEWVAYRRTA